MRAPYPSRPADPTGGLDGEDFVGAPLHILEEIVADLQDRAFEGYLCRVTFEGTTLVITDKTVFKTSRLRSGARISCQDISGVRLIEPTRSKHGRLRILVGGDSGRARRRVSPPPGAPTVLFTGAVRHQREIGDLVDVLTAIADANSDPSKKGATERLIELERVREAGLVSDDEYQAKRVEILESI